MPPLSPYIDISSRFFVRPVKFLDEALELLGSRNESVGYKLKVITQICAILMSYLCRFSAFVL